VLLSLRRHAAQRGLEERSVDAAVEDGDSHLHALADHLLLLHVKLLGKLGRGEVIGHGGPPLSLKSGREIFTPEAGRVNRFGRSLRDLQIASRDNARMPTAVENEGPNVASRPMPRRGRLWVVLILALALLALGYAVVSIATQKAGRDVVHLAGIAEAQEIFGGVPQEDDRLGSSDAPVTIQIFNDLQCSSCREDFLGTIPGLVNAYARPGDVKLLMRHYSVAENPLELGFFGAEAAAEQGYGWQYTYLFFRNQGEAERFGVDQDFLDSVAGGIEELNEPEWLSDLEENGGTGGAIAKRLESYDELGSNLGIRTRQAAIVSGPGGTRTLQDGPSLDQIEAAIEAVE
jgi:protein-disulfide isomerase